MTLFQSPMPLICGGRGDSFNDTCYVYRRGTGRWEGVYNLGELRHDMSSVSFPDWVLFIGGAKSEMSTGFRNLNDPDPNTRFTSTFVSPSGTTDTHSTVDEF